MELKGVEAEEALVKFWTKIYQCHGNDIEKIWNNETKERV